MGVSPKRGRTRCSTGATAPRSHRSRTTAGGRHEPSPPDGSSTGVRPPCAAWPAMASGRGASEPTQSRGSGRTVTLREQAFEHRWRGLLIAREWYCRARMPSTTKASRRDLPLICLLFSIFLAFGAGALSLDAWSNEPPAAGQLASVSGRVVDAYRKKGSGKGRPQVHLLVQAADGLHDFARDDMSPAISGALAVRKGDDVVALVQSGSIAQPADSLWELRKNSIALLRYEDVANQVGAEIRRESAMRNFLGGVAVLLLIAALALRRTFGAWRDPATASARRT